MDNGLEQQVYEEIKASMKLANDGIIILDGVVNLTTNLGFTFTVKTIVFHSDDLIVADYGIMIDCFNYESLIQLRDAIKDQQKHDAYLLDKEIDRLDSLYTFPQTQEELDDYHWGMHMEDIES